MSSTEPLSRMVAPSREDRPRATGTALPLVVRRLGPVARCAGVTFIEVVIASLIVAILATIAVPAYQNYQDRLKTARAVSDIAAIGASVATFAADNQGFPLTLAAVSPSLAAMRDPWGNAYQYVSHDDVKGKGKFRKDKNIVPINSDFDLWSMGPDGASVPPLTGKSSRDDIVRANNGRFIGVAAEYDP